MIEHAASYMDVAQLADSCSPILLKSYK